MNYFPTRPYNVIVVGSASGIGAATARFLARQGVHVACLDRETAAVAAVVEKIVAEGGSAEAHHADLCEPSSIAMACAAACESVYQIHGMVNCAGITGRTNIPGHEVDLDDFDLVYRINLRGAKALTPSPTPDRSAPKWQTFAPPRGWLLLRR